MGSRALDVQDLEMLLGCVSLIGVPAKHGISARQPHHQAVSYAFGQDRRRSNRSTRTIAVHQGFVVSAELGERRSIYDNMVRLYPKSAKRPAHSKRARTTDVVAIDLPNRGCPNAPRGRMPANENGGPFPLGRRHEFRIPQACDPETRPARWKDHRPGYHRPRQWPSPHFIETGNPLHPRRPQCAFATQCRAPHSVLLSLPNARGLTYELA